ncbi:MAG: cytochrome-c peroxidase [Planctomycetota bacterium]
MRRPFYFAVPLAAILGTALADETFVPRAPLGLDQAALDKALQQEPLTKAKVELGKQLYFDGRLSKDGTVSCASCHAPDHGFGDPGKFSKGVGGKLGGRHAPTVLNRVFGRLQFWDGRAATLEQQALGPIENPVEMAGNLDEAVKWLNQTEGYRKQFEQVFGGPATKDRIAKAIASFERTVLNGNSRVDLDEEAERWKKADQDELTAEQKTKAKAAIEAAAKAPLGDSERRGKALFFGKANCSLCHTGHNYTDEEFHNLGVGSDAREPDAGLAAVSKSDKDWGKFKTPTTRGLVGREPYMHDGSEATLEAVVDYYDRGGNKNKNLSDRMKPLGLSTQEKADLVAFLKALSGETTMVEKPKLP